MRRTGNISSVGRAVWAVAAMVFVLAVVAVPPLASADIDVEAALKERVIGDPAAPVTVIEYASLTCPACASFHNDAYKTFKKRYIDTGKVKLIYRDFPFDGVGLRAAMMARCGVHERYFPLIALLFRNQHIWSQAPDPLAELVKIGPFAGIDKPTFDECMASEELTDGILRVRQAAASRGVQRTPSFVIDNRIYPGPLSARQLAKIVDPLLKDR